VTIKEVSEKYNVPAETIRYYERVGAVPPITRTAGGIRDFQEEDIRWLRNLLRLSAPRVRSPRRW